MTRSLILEVDPAAFFEAVAAVGVDEAAKGIGGRVVASLLGGLDWKESVGLAFYGITATEPVRP